MTLVKATIVDDSIYVVSDTLLTPWNLEKQDVLYDAVVKTVLIEPTFALSFAGDSRVAGETIKKCFLAWRNLEVDEIIAKVFLDHFASISSKETATDFILAFLNPCRLVHIEGGRRTETSDAFIGDELGNIAFMRAAGEDRHFSSSGLPMSVPQGEGHVGVDLEIGLNQVVSQDPITAQYRRAMHAVIQDSSIPGVGGFPVVLASTPHGFVYGQYVALKTPMVKVDSLERFEDLPIHDSTRGSYSIYFSAASHHGIFFPLIYLPEASVGVIFGNKKTGLMRTVQVRARSFAEFLWATRDITEIDVFSDFPSEEELKVLGEGLFGRSFVVEGSEDVGSQRTSVPLAFTKKVALRTKKDSLRLIFCDSLSGGPGLEVRMNQLLGRGQESWFIQLSTGHRFSLLDVFRRFAIEQKMVSEMRSGDQREVYAYIHFDSSNLNNHFGLEVVGGVHKLSRLVISAVVVAL